VITFVIMTITMIFRLFGMVRCFERFCDLLFHELQHTFWWLTIIIITMVIIVIVVMVIVVIVVMVIIVIVVIVIVVTVTVIVIIP